MRSCVAVITLAFFALPASGAHLHLCLDGMGGEPTASVHTSAADILHAEAADPGHDDVEASFKTEALAKKVRSSLELGTPVPAVLALFVLPAAVFIDIPRESITPIAAANPYRVLPPTRAPPA
jgi:hypothetical protein